MLKKMTIPKKNNKIFIIVNIMFCTLLSACSLTSKDLIEEDFKFIRAGMTTDKIKYHLGKPDKVYRGQKEIQSLLEADANTNSEDRWASEYPEIYNNFYNNEKEEEQAIKKLNLSKKIFCYEYNYRYKKNSKEVEKWHIYFIDNKVIWMYFP